MPWFSCIITHSNSLYCRCVVDVHDNIVTANKSALSESRCGDRQTTSTVEQIISGEQRLSSCDHELAVVTRDGFPLAGRRPGQGYGLMSVTDEIRSWTS
ncbi:hypothetical protein EVAR_49501_1 [Eumeta japonica]|uniref:Uncharacterized protein n=1 Tax=Eumeta variegata TaxID=151549 RepID=A0A4C1VW79_EUMVA|nr:hypothetical protein EVAR_49501_1 [Eumeta japonica]